VKGKNKTKKQLIEELRNEHISIVETINNIEKLGIYTREGISELLYAKMEFIAHLKKEDTELYPKLKKIAEYDKEFRKKLDHLSRNLEEVTQFVLKFFDQYSAGGADIQFKSDCERLYSILKARILNEELLFKEYEKLKQ
jgi:iron-sulfur cluster repair protein YtfE (RIC family)